VEWENDQAKTLKKSFHIIQFLNYRYFVYIYFFYVSYKISSKLHIAEINSFITIFNMIMIC